MIDELEVVRRIGAADGLPDPAARERVRARLTFDPAARPRRRRRILPILGPALIAAAAVGLVLVLAGGGGGDDTASFSTPPAQQPAAPLLFPAADAFLYVHSRGAYLSCSQIADSEAMRCRLREPRDRESWTSERRTGLVVEGGDRADLDAGRTYVGNRAFTHDELATYAPTPQALLEELVAGRSPGQGGPAKSYPFTEITDALRDRGLPPAVRSALIGALPLVPGVTDGGEVTDSTGRAGRLYSRVNAGVREEAIVDPVSLTLLEERQIMRDEQAAPGAGLHVGDQIGGAVYLERAVVAQAGQRP